MAMETFFLTNEPEKLSYKLKKNVNYYFETKINIKNNSFKINFLKYKKKKT